MYPQSVPVINHNFDLTAMKAGDWFLGCCRCGFQLDNFTAAKPICPECGSALKINEVTEGDVPKREAP
jgi:rRNA maturation endonuclease Nob1